jgi:hypothetical protein
MPELATTAFILGLFLALPLPTSSAAAKAPAETTGEQRPLVAKVEHFFASASDAERLFLFFRDTLELPHSPAQEAGDVFTFGPGPRIRLVPAATASIQGLMVQVRSLEQARAFLAERQLLAEASTGAVTNAAQAIGGLSITLVESPAPAEPLAAAPAEGVVHARPEPPATVHGSSGE